MLRRVAADDRRDWDKMLPYVLFGIREVPQASTGFTPFELLFGRQPRGLLDVAREAWEHQPAAHRSTLEHVREMRERIDRVMPLVREHLTKAQQAQQRHYDRAAQPREFQPGDHVMVLVPTTACKFLATWQGPYTVTEKVGPVTYRVRQPGRRKEDQLYHINLLKRWVGTRTQLATLATSDPGVVDLNALLSDVQKRDLHHLIGQFSDVFSPIPGRTQVLQHDIRTPPGTVVRQRPYRVPEARRHAIEEEVQEMLRLGVIEPSRSPWSSPIVMVPKPDDTLRFCNDFRQLNEVSEFDGYPMPRVDELLDRLGGTRYISTLDLTKGYWQVPLTEEAKPKTAFSTPSGHWQYRVLPFGLHGAPATFQRMMDILLRPHQSYAAAYLDDVVVHSESWEEHLAQLRRVLLELRRAWTDRQLPQVSPGPLRGEIPGLPGGAGPNPTPREEGNSDSLGPATHHQDPGTSLFGVGRVLSVFHSQLLLFSLSPDRSDQEGTAGKGTLGSRRRGGLPTGEDGAHLRAHPASPRL